MFLIVKGGVQLVDLNFPPFKRRANRMGEE